MLCYLHPPLWLSLIHQLANTSVSFLQLQTWRIIPLRLTTECFLFIWWSSKSLCTVTRPIISPKACPDLWSSRPNLMGHQSSNPHQPAQWISATRIWSHPGPSQRPLTPTKHKSEVAPLGQRPAGVYPHPQVMWPDWPDPAPPGNRNIGSSGRMVDLKNPSMFRHTETSSRCNED